MGGSLASTFHTSPLNAGLLQPQLAQHHNFSDSLALFETS